MLLISGRESRSEAYSAFALPIPFAPRQTGSSSLPDLVIPFLVLCESRCLTLSLWWLFGNFFPKKGSSFFCFLSPFALGKALTDLNWSPQGPHLSRTITRSCQ